MPDTQSPPITRRLVYVDMAYTAKILRARRHENFWQARHSDGFFEKVLGVNPLANVADGEERRRSRLVRFSRDQIVIEGTSEACRLPRALMPINLLLSQGGLLLGLWRRLRGRRVDAVYANDPLYCGLFAMALARLLRRPLIVFIAAEYDEIYAQTGRLAMPRLIRSRRQEQAVLRYVLQRADMVVAVAKSVQDLARRYGTPEDRIAKLSHAKFLAEEHFVDPAERPSPQPLLESWGVPAGAPLLIYVGRQTAIKMPDHALRAMAEVLVRHPEAYGIMAGDGDMRGELEGLAASLGVADRVRFVGIVDQLELATVVPQAVTLSPLTGMALMEAALAGSPIVAYDRDWQSQFVRHDETGFIVPEDDWRAMGAQADRLISDAGLRRRMGEAARQRALEFTDRAGNSQREQAAFRELIDRWPHGVEDRSGR